MRSRAVVAALTGGIAAASTLAIVFAVASLRQGIAPAPIAAGVGAALAAAGLAGLVLHRSVGAPLVLAGVIWTAVLMAPYVGGAAELVSRLTLLPHALLGGVVLLNAVPRRRALAAGALAIAVALAAGLGLLAPALPLIGMCVLLGAARTRHPAPPSALSSLYVVTGSGLLAPSVGADVLYLGMIASALAAVIVEPNELWDALTSRSFASRLGDALGIRGLQVTFPADGTEWVDAEGCSRARDDRWSPVDENGVIIALLSRPVGTAPSELRTVLIRAGELARLRSRLRDRAWELAKSREILSTVAQAEAAALDRRVHTEVGAHLTAAVSALDSDPDLAALRIRATETADQLVGRIPTASGGLAASLTRLGGSSGREIRIEVDELDALPDEIRIPAAVVCIEGVVNALKHARGSTIHVVISSNLGRARVDVEDHGGERARPFDPQTLRERVCEAGGDIAVQATADGSRLTATFVLASAENRSGASASPDASTMSAIVRSAS